MRKTTRKIDGNLFRQLLIAGFRATISDKEYLNKINVFPVADSDTGTNLAMTYEAILDAINGADQPALRPHALLTTIADLAVDNARGNSGAIMAQYFEGLRASTGSQRTLNAAQLAEVLTHAAEQSWTAMSKPVAGTLPTVLIAHAEAWKQLSTTENDLQILFSAAYKKTQEALQKTTEQLPALRQAGVVDAGAQGFVDLLTGMQEFIENGCHAPENTTTIEHDAEPAATTNKPNQDTDPVHHLDNQPVYRFCTECVVVSDKLDRPGLIAALEKTDCDSLVVAGTTGKARVHLHTNNPAETFLLCEEFGQVLRQKADDMKRQHSLQAHTGKVAVVVDSTADIDADDIDRLHLHMVPVRLMLGDTEYLDKVSISPAEYYKKVKALNTVPKTSQPPPGDFRRQFELLTSHGYKVLYIGLSAALSGTFQAAITAAKNFDKDQIVCFNSRTATAGLGLMASYAAEAAAQGMDLEKVLAVTRKIRTRTTTSALITDLSWGAQGGRIPALALWLVKHLRLSPLIHNSPAGELKVYRVLVGRKNRFQRYAKKLSAELNHQRVYRIVIAHCDALENAKLIRRQLLQQHSGIYSCQIVDISPAIGAHVGLGGIAVGIQDYISPTNILEEGAD
ncbi:MAG: DegV family EDD domain-containing protein [Xanthomonadales bacterium]|nr:DegV family EDD domain-containing protein [Xanthomonadales bacterium]